jgi:hypothetical protein
VNKLLEIASAWISAANPTDVEREKAEKRIQVCNGCEENKISEILDYHYCGKCGCPLKKKIFSPLPGSEACPLGKWEA